MEYELTNYLTELTDCVVLVVDDLAVFNLSQRARVESQVPQQLVELAKIDSPPGPRGEDILVVPPAAVVIDYEQVQQQVLAGLFVHPALNESLH